MQPAPTVVGGGTVIAYSTIDHRHVPTGGCRQVVAGVLQGPASGLAICTSDCGNSFYLFGCDDKWQTRTDTWHQTLEEAMGQAEFEYEGVRKTWLNHQPAWTKLADSERSSIWDLAEEQFKFRPSIQSSDWRGIVEPLGSITFDISHLFDGSEAARLLDEDSLNAESLNLFRQCVSPGEKLYALDWQHPAYSFNPFRSLEFSHFGNNMIPFIPNGDYYIFLADDLRFGTFGHPWEQTICVSGQPLLEVVMRDKPQLFHRIIRRNGQPV